MTEDNSPSGPTSPDPSNKIPPDSEAEQSAVREGRITAGAFVLAAIILFIVFLTNREPITNMDQLTRYLEGRFSISGGIILVCGAISVFLPKEFRVAAAFFGLVGALLLLVPTFISY